jgi:hypothetical protein
MRKARTGSILLLAVDSTLIVLNGPDPFSSPVVGPLLSCHIDHDVIAKTGDAGDRNELRSESSIALSVEILGLAAGLAIVLGHNIWSSGLLALIVTLIGWSTLIRSIILLFLSPEAIERFIKAVRYEQNYYLFTAIPLLIGLYLTVAGLGLG